MIPIEAHDPGSLDWQEQRAARIGGSEISAVLGLSSFQSRYALWHEKKGHRSEIDKPEVEWGNRLEDAVIIKFLDEHPEYAPAGRGTWLDSERLWMIASPDQLLRRPGTVDLVAGLEAKTSPRGEGFGPSGSEDFPIYYYCQCLWNMHVTRLDRWHLAVLIGGCNYREYVIDRTDDTEDDLATMIEQGEEFVASLINNEPPDVDEHGSTYELIREQHPEIELDLRADVDPVLAGEYILLQMEAKSIDKRLTGVKSRLMIEMDTAQYAEVAGERFALRTFQTRNGKQGAPFIRPHEKNIKRLIARLAREQEEVDHGRTSEHGAGAAGPTADEPGVVPGPDAAGDRTGPAEAHGRRADGPAGVDGNQADAWARSVQP